MTKADPLSPGHVEGQNPAPSERHPVGMASIASDPRGNEEELGGRLAFLFRSANGLA